MNRLAEQDGGKLEFELTEASLPEFEPSKHAEYYQAWLSDGSVFARSPSLLGADLEFTAGTAAAPAFQHVRLPDGRWACRFNRVKRPGEVERRPR